MFYYKLLDPTSFWMVSSSFGQEAVRSIGVVSVIKILSSILIPWPLNSSWTKSLFSATYNPENKHKLGFVLL